MIPAGYLAKRIQQTTAGLEFPDVQDIYSVSGCISEIFADYIDFWRHNGFWLFDSPDMISELALANGIRLDDCKFFYYELFEQEYDRETKSWSDIAPDSSFHTSVKIPNNPVHEGFDVVTFFGGSSPECSPLSCNGLANDVHVNKHCLLETFESAKALVESESFVNVEPGPVRIFGVYSLAKT